MLPWLQLQKDLFILAITFLSRLPVPAVREYSDAKLNQCRRYFPLVGLLIGALCAVVLYSGTLFVPVSVAVLLSMIVSLLSTGCFHEDGLADTADGLGGGWSREQKLTIMKDSRIGTYGSAALWCILSLKFFLLFELASLHLAHTVLALLVMHCCSRALSSVLVIHLPYVRTSSDKPVVQFHNHYDTFIALSIAGASLLLLPAAALPLIAIWCVFGGIWHMLLKRQLGGYTGDTLGAAQQIAECLGYLTVLSLWHGGNLL